MPVTPPDDSVLVVSIEELQRAAQKSLKGDVSDADTAAEWAQALEDAQETVEGYLGRNLFVGRYAQPFARCDVRTEYRTEEAPSYELFAVHKPVFLAVNEAGLDEDELVTIGAAGQLVLGPDVAVPGTATYYAGYRGRHHTLDGANDTAALTDIEGLEELDALPPVVPADIRRTIIEIALVDLNQARAGLLGGVGSYQRVGEATVDVSRVDPQAEARALERVKPYRRQLVGV